MYNIYLKILKRRMTVAIINTVHASNPEAGCVLNGSSHSTEVRQSPLDCAGHRHCHSMFHTFVHIFTSI